MFDFGLQPDSLEGWCAVAARNRDVAFTLLANGHTVDAWGHAGFAVECSLKAAIMSHRGLNRWPSRLDRADLYSHNLGRLAAEAGIDLHALVREPVGPAFQTVLLWHRAESYNPRLMPGRVAQDIVDAAFQPGGVVEWLCERYRLNI